MKSKIAFAVILIVTAINVYADNTEKGERTFKLGKGGSLTLELNVGSIVVKSWDKEEVKLSAEGISQSDLNSMEVLTKGNELWIKYWKNDDDDYRTVELQIPAKLNLNLKTMAGDINLETDLEGMVRLDSYGGNISTNNIVGALAIETKGGDITVKNVSGNCNVNTYGGNIEIGEIKEGNATVLTNGGDVKIISVANGAAVRTYGGDINIGNIGGNSDLSTYGGDVVAGFVKGNLKMETYGGDLNLKGADGSVIGKTNGGDIDLGKVIGSVDVKTLSGSITVELIPSLNSESKISTNFGSIDLIIPPTVKTTVEAKIHVNGYWKEDKNNYKLNSEYKEKSIEFDDDKRNIIGVYEINGGGSKVFVKTINEDITISKTRKTPKEK